MGRFPRQLTRRKLRMVDALFTSTQQKVLGLFFCFPDRRYFPVELVEQARGGTGAVRRELEALVAARLVLVSMQGKRRLYQANRAAPVFHELHRLMVKTVGVADPIRDALRPISKRIERAFIYGSVAEGTEHAESDVDLVVVADGLTLEELFRSLSRAERRIGRSISPSLYARREYATRVQNKSPFLTKVLAKDRITIIDT